MSFATPISPASGPMSPVSATVRRQRSSQPNIAVVRRISLSRPHSATLVPLDAETSSRPASSNGSLQPAGQRGRPPRKPTVEEVLVRPLSRQEAAEKRDSAIQFFREARAINRRSQSLADLRRQQRERSASAEPRSRQASKESASPPAKRSKQPGEAAEAEEQCSVTEHETTTEPPKRKSLAEQFGYGVAPKNQQAEWRSSQPEAPVAEAKQSGFIKIAAGDSDILRLRQRKSVVAAGA